VSALEEAVVAHEQSEYMDRQGRFDAAVSLAEWDVFSSIQIAKIVGLPRVTVSRLIGKKDRTGGRLPLASLRPLLDLSRARSRGEVDLAAVKTALDAGASRRMASRLTSIPETTLKRHYDRATAEMKEEA
jgi:hypothetical protein